MDDIEDKDARAVRHLAAEAARLKADPVLSEAINQVLADARDALETCPPERLVELQGTAAAIRNIWEKLEAAILAGASLPSVNKTDNGVV